MPGFDLDSLVYPLFVKDGINDREEVLSMPGVYRYSLAGIIDEVGALKNLGIRKVLLFGTGSARDERGYSAYKYGNIISKVVTSLKKHHPEVTIMTDVCLCAYTSHGHCGIIKSESPSVLIDNSATLSALVNMALSHAVAGVDYVAPSAMADGQVGAIRRELDKNGYQDTRIMGYSAKFASGFYGPFRDAAGSGPKFGDRRGYQLDPSDGKQALKEIGDDIAEGADIVMVKPAMPYLDIIREAKDKFGHTLAAYNVSGEYAMVKAGVKAGFWREAEIVSEILTGVRRAGADIIITYHARDIAEWVRKGKFPDENKQGTEEELCRMESGS